MNQSLCSCGVLISNNNRLHIKSKIHKQQLKNKLHNELLNRQTDFTSIRLILKQQNNPKLTFYKTNTRVIVSF
jgi:hypothetical protein